MNVLEQAAALGFASLGQAIVVLVGGIDLSVGATVAVCTVVLSALAEQHPSLMVPLIAVTLLFGAAIGAVNGLLTVRTGVHPLIVTLGTASVLNGAVLLYTLQPTGGVPSWFQDFAYGRLGPFPLSGLLMLACFAVMAFWLARSRTGRAIYAVGGSVEAARLTGLRTGRTIVTAYALSGFFAALTALYYVSRTGTGDPRVGEPLTLASITPVVVGGVLLGGGRGGVGGVLLGVFLISLLNNLLNYMNVSTFLQWVAQGLIIIAAVSFAAGRRRPA
jgi:ribose/xylose/arabinose/galactoside ABC-type transport system permease subunit